MKSPIRFEENNFFITKYYNPLPELKQLFLLGAEESCSWWICGPWPHKPELQNMCSWIFFGFLRVQTSFSWTQKLVVLNSNVSFWRPLRFYSWSLKVSIPDLCQLVFWLTMAGFPKSNQDCMRSVASILFCFCLEHEVKAQFWWPFCFHVYMVYIHIEDVWLP